MHPQTFLFDLDGTLVDSVADLATAVNLLRGELDLPPLDLPTVRRHVGDGATMLMTRSLPEGWFSRERLERFLSLYRDNLLVHTVVYPGIRDFLDLHRHCKMAVVTNKPFVFARDLLEGLDLLRYFPVVLGGESCPAKKPDPAPVLCALDALGAQNKGAVMIGDHHTDLKSGRSAGILTCFCAWGIGQDGGVPHDFRAEDPRDLLKLFP
jgi:phosphoglycolate phosphatase